MKKLIYIAVLILVCVAFSACGDNAGVNGGRVGLMPIDNLSEYVIVRGENSSNDITMLVTSLRKEINDATGASVAVKTDYYTSQYEILIGETKRQQSIDAMEGLRYYDYSIKMIGNKIVVVGGSDEALVQAVGLFKRNFIDSEKKTIKIPAGKGYTYRAKYALDKLTVDGVDFSEFKIVNQSFADAEAFSAGFNLVCGFSPEINELKMLDDEHYIILDGTELVEHKFSIKFENGNVVIKGSSHSIDDAMEYFRSNMLKSDKKTLKLTAKDNYEGSTGKKETYTKEQLGNVIQQLYDDPNTIAFGEEIDVGKTPTVIEDSIVAFKETTGEMPAIMGIDLACYGLDLTLKDDLYLSSYICDIVEYVSGGGIITASAHWENPSQTGEIRVRGRFGTEDTREAYEKAFTDLITDGTEYNEFFKKELEVNARFFKALEENGVSIIWRPLHEANGNWFWYCIGQNDTYLDAKYYVDMWHYIYNYFENECGLTNLYWNFSPNYSENVSDSPTTRMSTTYLYPGDEYCDMVGVDWYSNGNLEISIGYNYLNLVDLSRKPGAINEFGPNGGILADKIADQPALYDCMDMYDDVYELIGDGHSFAYLLEWCGKWGISALGKGDELMQTDLFIGQAELKAMFDAIK